MKRRGFIGWIGAAALGLSLALPAHAQLTQGKEYTVIEPQLPSGEPGKIEVLEFFSYGCIHCFRLHPYITKWASTLPKDVVFKRVPVTFDRPQMVPIAKLYYTLETTGDLDKLDDAVFKALHEENANLATDKAVLDWVGKRGVDMKKFTETYNSFGIQSKVSRATQMTKSYHVQGTPQVVVDGRYAVRGEGIQGYDQIPVVTGKLVDMARAAKAKK